jgi:hypothetical protein
MKSWVLAGAISLVAAVVAALAFGAWKNSDFVDGQSDRLRMEGTFVNGFYDQGIEDVGFIAQPDKHVTARRLLDSRVIYDASYTTGPDRFRVVPKVEGAPRCLLQFGDSFTFGEGVDDDETSAAQIVARSRGEVEVKSLDRTSSSPDSSRAVSSGPSPASRPMPSTCSFPPTRRAPRAAASGTGSARSSSWTTTGGRCARATSTRWAGAGAS